MRFFKFIEMIRSSKANECGIDNIDNWPKDADIMDNIIFTMECLDQIREEYGLPLSVSSGYRCPELNRAVGGAKTSQHMKGQAADINLGSVEKNRAFFNWCQANINDLPIDQLLDESNYSWVHLSFTKENQRHQVLHL